MSQQISESELVIMKIIWEKGGVALYSCIMEELDKDKNEWKKIRYCFMILFVQYFSDKCF